jgi:hypothetical protein
MGQLLVVVPFGCSTTRTDPGSRWSVLYDSEPLDPGTDVAHCNN